MICTITTVRRIGKTRCIGYCFNFQEACKMVEENCGDMFEDGYYRYVVVERVREGIYNYDTNATWFKWNGIRYERTKQPDRFKKTIGFGIG